jgi:chromosome segregation ATPase
MHPSLEHLIRLQQLETDAGERKRRLADLPARVTDADAAVAAARAAREAVAAQIAENTASRRAADKELGVVQARLTKYKDQLMEVKTNKEYTTMQHEIATAEDGVRGFEDQILTLMMAADELTAAQKAADAALAAEERKAAGVRTEVGTALHVRGDRSKEDGACSAGVGGDSQVRQVEQRDRESDARQHGDREGKREAGEACAGESHQECRGYSGHDRRPRCVMQVAAS